MGDYHRVFVTFFRFIHQSCRKWIEIVAADSIRTLPFRAADAIFASPRAFPYKVLPNYQATFMAVHRFNLVCYLKPLVQFASDNLGKIGFGCHHCLSVPTKLVGAQDIGSCDVVAYSSVWVPQFVES